MPECEKRGHRVVVPELPKNETTSNAARYARIVADAIRKEGNGEPAMVVAHSASGLLLPLVPVHCSVFRMVFLAAAIPQIGKSFMEQVKENPDMLWPDWIGKDPTSDHSVALHYLFHDCSPEIARWALSTLDRTFLNTVMAEICPLDAWPATPSSYIVCTEDRTARPQWCEQAARNMLHVEPIELAAGHCPHVSRPKELGEILNGLATD